LTDLDHKTLYDVGIVSKKFKACENASEHGSFKSKVPKFCGKDEIMDPTDFVASLCFGLQPPNIKS